MQWTIRSPEKADLEELADIYLAVRRDTFTWVDPQVFRHEDFHAHTQGELLWLAEMPDGEIAGFMTLWSPDDFIHMLYIRKQYRGLGIGQALLKTLPYWPDKTYRLKCLDRNEHAKAFYRARGFVVTGKGSSREGEYEEMTFFPER
ncbi:GNAT family N-acetyltransferase [Rhizobium sp. 16-449-1b]|uniref:GNAT family N-acetyltransferase n=1 Tax=Rhizobium sp. 16-449-1b TaxID=2819989 RepID=UPI001ADAA0CC|nr:GNAT family N-acetyltransferase [Rhizobium sp. 16-449-1b]MBO9192833.1 GNAT family N-acetyltransferase [Rhizobium sp. 16-449-1b]